MNDIGAAPPLNRDGDNEVINGVTFIHRFARGGGITWHYVETGARDAEDYIFLHGGPESWYSWHYQMEGLATRCHCISIDLKGFGQTDKPDGDYSVTAIAKQLSELIAGIGVKRYNLSGHDWGTMVGDPLADRDQDKVIRYLRMQGWVLVQDTTNVPHALIFKKDPGLAEKIMVDADKFVRLVYAKNTVKPVPEHDLQRIILEFSRPGIAQAFPRYFRDLDENMQSEEGLRRRKNMFASWKFPVLLLQADSDPLQPQRIFDSAISAFQNATLVWVTDSGHFTELEQPEQVTRALLDYMAKTPGQQ